MKSRWGKRRGCFARARRRESALSAENGRLAAKQQNWKCGAVSRSRETPAERQTQLSSSCNSADITRKMLKAALLSVCAVACCQIFPAAARSDGGNFLDDKWLSGRWDQFRDEAGTWNPGKPFDQALDPAKDPCLKIKCSRHKVCVVEGHRTNCISQRRMSFKWSIPPRSAEVTGTPTPQSANWITRPAFLGSRSPSSARQCPCPSDRNRVEKKVCSDAEIREVVNRLRDWFKVLHENGDQSKRAKVQRPERSRFDTSILPICKDSLGWMFNRLDTNFDLLLDQSELRSLYLDKNERCTKSFLSSCDTYDDGLISNNEWCSCFQRQQDPPCRSELSSINRQHAGKKLLGSFVPSCDADGYYKSHQCHGSSGQCWCVDRYGNEVVGSRTHGPTDCGVELESSGDFGSGDLYKLSDDEDDEDEVLDEDEMMDDDDEDDDEDDDDGYVS
ncbi:hypothetical protein AAFF_G00413410 [Aldrovandia affinis]|uniref:Thyroglobulin type-1 domain-containing protein n=1 Tax=Aldrovandia affinis TaxID=143900 RepID=A0AAD7SBJ9_9TELE|nr:hypothetical protein AAFF_G00413410 [Aldrovandia affinis]